MQWRHPSPFRTAPIPPWPPPPPRSSPRQTFSTSDSETCLTDSFGLVEEKTTRMWAVLRRSRRALMRSRVSVKNSGVGRVGLQRRFLSNWATIPIHSFSLSAQKVVRPTGFSHPLTPTPTSERCFVLPRQPPSRSPTTAGHPRSSHHHPARSNKDDGVERRAEAHPALEDPPG
jgi:hypothetical protein